MTIFEDGVRPSDSPDIIRARIEELKARLELTTDEFDRQLVESEIRWSEKVLERSKFVVTMPDGSFHYSDGPA